MNPTGPVSARGSWPGSVVLRSGWSKAHARPLNDDLPDAALRLERGGSGFLRRCAGWLFEEGVSGVQSGPLHDDRRRPWEAAGFRLHRSLTLLERELGEPPAQPPVPVRPGRADEWGEATSIDRAAFAPEWRLGRLGLADAAAATPRSRFLVAEQEGRVAGFAIVGTAYQTGYLQRLAVHPDAGGRGLGRALVRGALAWARGHGARTMLLNTQPDNQGAISLYQSEGFEVLPKRLVVLRATPDPAPPT